MPLPIGDTVHILHISLTQHIRSKASIAGVTLDEIGEVFYEGQGSALTRHYVTYRERFGARNNGSEDGDGEERKGLGAVTLCNDFVSGVPALSAYCSTGTSLTNALHSVTAPSPLRSSPSPSSDPLFWGQSHSR